MGDVYSLGPCHAIVHEVAKLKHDSWVVSVRYSPDGALLATGSCEVQGRAACSLEGCMFFLAAEARQTSASASLMSRLPKPSWSKTDTIASCGFPLPQLKVSKKKFSGLVTSVDFSPDSRSLVDS